MAPPNATAAAAANPIISSAALVSPGVGFVGHDPIRHHSRPNPARSSTNAPPMRASDLMRISDVRILRTSEYGRQSARPKMVTNMAGRMSMFSPGGIRMTTTARIPAQKSGDTQAVTQRVRVGLRASSRWTLRVTRSDHHQPAPASTIAMTRPIQPSRPNDSRSWVPLPPSDRATSATTVTVTAQAIVSARAATIAHADLLTSIGVGCS